MLKDGPHEECHGERDFPEIEKTLPGGGSLAIFPSEEPGTLCFNVRPGEDGTVLIGDWSPGREGGTWGSMLCNERTRKMGPAIRSDDLPKILEGLPGDDKAAVLETLGDPDALLVALSEPRG